MKLNARQVESAKPKDKAYKLADGGGLYLLVNPNGSRYWRLKYRIAGKEKLLALGVYPAVTLAAARLKRDEAKKCLADGLDPTSSKPQKNPPQQPAITDTFEQLAWEWHDSRQSKWSENYAREIINALSRDVFPWLGGRAIKEIEPLELLAVLKRIEDRGAIEQAKKVRQRCREIWNYAIVTGRAIHNPAAVLIGAMNGHTAEHFPFLQAGELPAFFAVLESVESSRQVVLALKLIMLVALRPKELREAVWAEIDFDNALWEIPKERMKKRRPHLIPLSRQAIAILQELKALAGHNPFVFPGRNDPRQPMSEGAINQLIKRMGYRGRATGHGFRHTLSTVLHEQGYNTAWIETQLAHVDKNSIRGTYNHAQYLEGRREMMQWYADYLEALEHKRSTTPDKN